MCQHAPSAASGMETESLIRHKDPKHRICICGHESHVCAIARGSPSQSAAEVGMVFSRCRQFINLFAF